MVDDREGTAVSVSGEFVWDLAREVDCPEADDWDLDWDLLGQRVNLLLGAVGSLGQGLVGLWDGEDVGLVRIGMSDATVE